MKQTLKKLFKYCDTCNGIFNTHAYFCAELKALEAHLEELTQIKELIERVKAETPWMWEQRLNWKTINKVINKYQRQSPDVPVRYM